MASTWLGVILIGFLAGLVARLFSSHPRDPQGCMLTTVLGVVGAGLFTWLGQMAGLYGPGERAGFIGAVIGSLIVLALWRMLLEKK